LPPATERLSASLGTAKVRERDEMRRQFEGLPAIPQGPPTAGNL
jgi:hypothetical protein